MMESIHALDNRLSSQHEFSVILQVFFLLTLSEPRKGRERDQVFPAECQPQDKYTVKLILLARLILYYD